MLADDGEGFAELALDFGGGGEHERDDFGSDQLLLGVGNRGRGSNGGGLVGGGGGGPPGLKVVLEVDDGGYADLLVDGGLGDEAEDGAAVLGAVGGVEEGGLGLAAGLGGGGEGVEEALGEEMEGFWVAIHGCPRGV